jgi:ribose transport system permease protein
MNNEDTPDRIQQDDSSTVKKILNFVNKNNTFFVFALLLIVSATLTSNFFTLQNITNLLRQNAPLGIAAVGMLLVIFTGGIDLSIGATLTLSSIVFARLLVLGYSVPVSIIAAMAAALVCGVVSGMLVAYQRLAPFVVTLAVMSIARGFAYIICKGASIPVKQGAFITFSKTYILGIPVQFLIMITIYIIMALIFRYMTFGRLVVAIGSNEEAVRLSGIRVRRYILSVYCISALFASIAGVLLSGRMGVGSPIVGNGMEMDIIAAVVIGGTPMRGGNMNIIGTVFGCMIVGIVNNIMNLLGINANYQIIAKGMMILFALILDRVSTKFYTNLSTKQTLKR